MVLKSTTVKSYSFHRLLVEFASVADDHLCRGSALTFFGLLFLVCGVLTSLLLTLVAAGV